MPKSGRLTIRPVAQRSILDKKYKKQSSSAPRIQFSKVHSQIVIADLKRGSLKSLARYLRQTGGIDDPVIARILVRLIDGSARVTPYRIFVSDHPERTRAKGGRPPEQSQSPPSEEQKQLVALYEEMLRTEGKRYLAVTTTAKQANVSESKVQRAIRKSKEHKQILAEAKVEADARAAGMVEVDRRRKIVLENLKAKNGI
jgi:hypothetical protein